MDRRSRGWADMNFDFSDDQKFLKGEARKFLEANCPTTRVRKVLDDEAKGYDADLWKAVAGQGWLGAAIPEEFGGLGLGHLELCVIAEELGRAVAPIPFASTVYILAEAVMLAGSDAQKADLLPKIAGGEVIGCLATSEGPGAVSAATVQAVVEGGKLTGAKVPVTDGDIADVAIVLAKEGGKPGLFLVDLTGAGVAREAMKTLDPTRDAAKLTFSGAAAVRLGGAGEGLDLLEPLLVGLALEAQVGPQGLRAGRGIEDGLDALEVGLAGATTRHRGRVRRGGGCPTDVGVHVRQVVLGGRPSGADAGGGEPLLEQLVDPAEPLGRRLGATDRGDGDVGGHRAPQ